MFRITVNGNEHEVSEGATILEVLRSLDIEVPTLCHDSRLKPYGGCRLCSVEVEGSPRLIASCTTPVWDGMKIATHSKMAEDERRTILNLLAQNYPAEEPLNEHLEFHRYLKQYGVRPSGMPLDDVFRDDEHPYMRVDMSKCVYCYRCVRICDELQGQFVWRVWNRGDKTRIRPDKGETLLGSSCVSCGACVDTCPSGALMDVAAVKYGPPDTWTRTTCPYCGVGCELEVGVKDGVLRMARPSKTSPVNKGHLCIKGRYAFDYPYSKDRVTTPLIRENGAWKSVGWSEAYAFTARRLKEILNQHGPEAVGVLGSSRATNEENYLAQKFSRVVLGSNNVDCCARVCHAPTAAALKATLGTGAATNCFDDIEVSRAFLVSGSNTTEAHPVVGARIKQAVLNGAKLVVVDPRRIELSELADVHLQITPGTNVAVMLGIARAIIEEGLVDEAFLATRTSDYEAFKEFLAEWTPEKAGEIAGVDPEDIRRAARLYATTKPGMIFHGLGMTEHFQGTEGVRCLVNLALLTGNIGKPGTGENPLRGQNNVQGSAHMGCEPDHLAGYVPLVDAAERFEGTWKVPVPRIKGMNWMKMLDAAGAGSLKAVYAIGYDVYFSNPNATATAESLRKLDLLIVQDLFMNETAREFAHVFLPCASNFEKDGTFMNSERRVQRVRKAIEPIGGSRPDWQITSELAAEMGFGEHFAFADPNAIWEEVRQVWKPGAGISYARIEQVGLQWPCTDETHPGTRILHGQTFPHGDRAAFSLIPYVPSEETVNDEYPMILNTGRSLYQFNAGTMTLRTDNIRFRGSDYLEICPKDATRLGVHEGDPVRIVSRYGSAVLHARVAPIVREGQLFATFHDPKVFTNRVTGPHRDRVTSAGEYKVTAVRVEKT